MMFVAGSRSSPEHSPNYPRQTKTMVGSGRAPGGLPLDSFMATIDVFLMKETGTTSHHKSPQATECQHLQLFQSTRPWWTNDNESGGRWLSYVDH